MMNYFEHGYGATMSGSGLIMLMVHIVILVDLILLGAWLWKQLKKK